MDHTVCPHTTGTIQLSPKAYSKVLALMSHFDVEWLAYLVGRVDGETVRVTDLTVPAQRTTRSTVDEVEEAPPQGTVGVMHSHVKMGAFFSGTDDKYINDNHDVSIVVSWKDDELVFKSQVRRQVPCGVSMVMVLPVTVVIQDQRTWLQGVIDKVKDVVRLPNVVVGAPSPTPRGFEGLFGQRFDVGAKKKSAGVVAYNKCVEVVAHSKQGATAQEVLSGITDDELEAALDHLEGKQGSVVLIEMFEEELDRRVETTLGYLNDAYFG